MRPLECRPNRETSIIALTAAAMKEDRERCLDAGCADYITKPLSKAELLRLLAKYLKAPA